MSAAIIYYSLIDHDMLLSYLNSQQIAWETL